MKKFSLLVALLAFFVFSGFTQEVPSVESWQTVYRAFPEKVNDLVHVKLDAHFDYQKSQMNGKVWLTLKPHFYPVDSVRLDAKSMDIYKVQLVGKKQNIPLEYLYDSLQLSINLGRTYTADEDYTLYIEYTANPNKIKEEGSAAITGAKGLYFINPRGEDKDKPTQIWTQGETESNSGWIPIIDKPNQKATSEMILTVPDQYVTLSNGTMIRSKKNRDGTRTDTWEMKQPHAPYLFFMGVGDYAIVKDFWNGKEVSYYVEKPYKDLARRTFGETPAMIQYFSETLGVDYPWAKYAQMTARDYISGAMENTTATLHGDGARLNDRKLTDGNTWEAVIAHELFHQWFGDLVTCESWSNITVNESFADFSEIMWMEHRYGPDEGMGYAYSSRTVYLNNDPDTIKPLVRYHYARREDVFDRVSYNKGGAILYMLRDFLGEKAFYKSLQTYLERNRFGTGNARKLQQAFEDVSGKDLSWFFNQWYYGKGHPQLDISYTYSDSAKQATVYVKQKQTTQIFKLPVWIDIYEGDRIQHNFRWVENSVDTLRFNVDRKPDLINFDAKKVLLANKSDHKSFDEFIFQYQHAQNYLDRREAVVFALTQPLDSGNVAFLRTALKDPNYRIRGTVLNGLGGSSPPEELLADVEVIVKDDPKKFVRAGALNVLGACKDDKYKELFVACLDDSSYTVAGAAYNALLDLDEPEALAWLPKLKEDAQGLLKNAVQRADFLTKTDADFDDVYAEISDQRLFEKFGSYRNFLQYLDRLENPDNFIKGTELILKFRDQAAVFVAHVRDDIDERILELKKNKEKNKEEGKMIDEMEVQIQYLDGVIKKERQSSGE